MEQIVVYKGRTNTLSVSLGFDVSQDEFYSQIRVDRKNTSDLIATWNVSFLNDGVDGELILTLDDSVTGSIIKNVGYMDIKRVSNGEPLPVLDKPVEVLFKNPITT